MFIYAFLAIQYVTLPNVTRPLTRPSLTTRLEVTVWVVPSLLENAVTAAQSPYVIAMTRAGIKVLPHIVNACIFTSAFSAGNSFLYASSRVLYGLALRGQAPKVFAWCTKGGLPIVAVAATSCFAWLSFMNTSSGAVKVFK